MRPILQLSHIASLGTIALLLLMVACGTAAPATPSASQAEPPVDTSATAVPTANPTPMPESSSATAVNPGKLTWMTAGWGNERFTYNYGVGGGNNYGRILHGFLIATNEKTELLPGIATDWQISEDGLTWTVTIREGVKFHNGSDLTAEDVAWTWQHEWGPEALEYSDPPPLKHKRATLRKLSTLGLTR